MQNRIDLLKTREQPGKKPPVAPFPQPVSRNEATGNVRKNSDGRESAHEPIEGSNRYDVEDMIRSHGTNRLRLDPYDFFYKHVLKPAFDTRSRPKRAPQKGKVAAVLRREETGQGRTRSGLKKGRVAFCGISKSQPPNSLKIRSLKPAITPK